MFWVDLSTAGLIDTMLNTASSTIFPGINPLTPTTTPSISAYMPTAKMGQGNFVYVWSQSGINYFGLFAYTSIQAAGAETGNPGMTVQQAFAIDNKIDDGLPETGRVLAQYVGSGQQQWASINAYWANPSGSSATCFDNGSSGGGFGHQTYSMGSLTNYGANTNCALTFQMQGAGR